MINFNQIESKVDEFESKFMKAELFPHLIIDNFCHEDLVRKLYEKIPDYKLKNRSRDQFFSQNKFERSNIKNIDLLFKDLNDDLLSSRFKNFLIKITGQKVFVDEKFHGGGIHQGIDGSYLNLHTDFNYHPNNKNWYRYLNILLYLNPGWESTWGGELYLKNKNTKFEKKIEPIFNRLVIMRTNNISLHGYNKINFPKNIYRTSIASYAYTLADQIEEKVRTTNWDYDWNKPIKKIASIILPPIIIFKNKYFGNRTSKN